MKAQNGKVYVNVACWVNDKPDKYENDASLMLQSQKDMREKEGKVYIGNLKEWKTQTTPVEASDIDDDLPF